MKTRTLERAWWPAYFEAQANVFRSSLADVHTLDESRKRFALAWAVPVDAIGYDPAGDVFFVLAGEFEHWIRGPRAMAAMENAAGEVRGLEVVDGDGIRHIVALKLPLALPG